MNNGRASFSDLLLAFSGGMATSTIILEAGL